MTVIQCRTAEIGSQIVQSRGDRRLQRGVVSLDNGRGRSPKRTAALYIRIYESDEEMLPVGIRGFFSVLGHAAAEAAKADERWSS